MIKSLYRLISWLLALKIFFWAQPDSKRFLKFLLITIFLILIIFYIHSEYLNWIGFSDSKKYLTESYLLKNILIIISLLFFYFKIKKKNIYTNNKDENYLDKFLEVKKDKLNILNNEPNISNNEDGEKIYTSKKDKNYLDKFLKIKKLKSRTDFILEKKINEKKK